MVDNLTNPNPDADPREHDPDKSEKLSDLEIVNILEGYRLEAEQARWQGQFPRDDIWQDNIDLYWNRFDFSKKAEWQATEVLPEAPQFVNRFAAAMRQSLTRDGEFFTVTHPADPEGNLTPIIKKAMQIWLDRCGRNATGHVMEFGNVFEDIMKLAAMMAACGAVTQKERDGVSYTAIDPVDPREVFLDPTGRGLYRIKTTFIDKHELLELAEKSPSRYNHKNIEQLQAFVQRDEKEDDERLADHGKEETSTREPIRLDEYLCDLIDNEGKVRFTNYLFVVANNQWLIRGPEKNPFWHKKDWIVFAPAISVPFSIYGKTYMEDWSKLARTFNELTNLIIDAVHTNSMNAFIARPSALEDPDQLSEGVHPSKTFFAEDDEELKNIILALELGKLPPEAITLWQALKKELQEGALFSEIALGQLSRGEKTATEISESQQGSATTLQSIARNIETQWLEPTLDLVWKTGLQHMKEGDTVMRAALGDANFEMLLDQRKNFVQQNITFKVDAISGLIDRNEKFRKMVSMLQIVASNELLLKAFLQNADITLVVRKLFTLNGIDLNDLQPNKQQQQIQSVVDKSNQRADVLQEQNQNATPLPTGDEIAANLAQVIPRVETGGGNGAG